MAPPRDPAVVSRPRAQASRESTFVPSDEAVREELETVGTEWCEQARTLVHAQSCCMLLVDEPSAMLTTLIGHVRAPLYFL